MGWYIAIVTCVLLSALMLRFFHTNHEEYKRKVARQEKAFETHFAEFDDARLETSTSYGYPAFSVIFRTKEDLRCAEERGHIAKFIREIQNIYGRPKSNFSAERAVYGTYQGETEEWMAENKHVLDDIVEQLRRKQ